MSGSPYPSCTMGPSRGARQGAFKTLGPSGWASLYLYSSPHLPSTLTRFSNGLGVGGSHDSSELLLP